MVDVDGAHCVTDAVRDMTLAKITLQHIPSAAAVVCLNGATVAIASAQCTTADALEVGSSRMSVYHTIAIIISEVSYLTSHLTRVLITTTKI